MAHFAKLDDNNIVLAVHALDNHVTADSEGVEDENIGVAYLTKIHKHSNWKQTSYNDNFRKQYAGIGYTYDTAKDKFIKPQPFPSWSLDENDNWNAPVIYPSIPSYIPDGQSEPLFYMINWDEPGQKWIAYNWESPPESFNWNVDTGSWDSV